MTVQRPKVPREDVTVYKVWRPWTGPTAVGRRTLELVAIPATRTAKTTTLSKNHEAFGMWVRHDPDRCHYSAQAAIDAYIAETLCSLEAAQDEIVGYRADLAEAEDMKIRIAATFNNGGNP